MTRQNNFQNPGESAKKNYFSPIPAYPKNANQIENPHFCAAITVSRNLQKAPAQNEPIHGVPRNTPFLQNPRNTRFRLSTFAPSPSLLLSCSSALLFSCSPEGRNALRVLLSDRRASRAVASAVL